MPKISALTGGTNPAGTEVAPFVQGGATVKLTVDQLSAAAVAYDAELAAIAGLTSAADKLGYFTGAGTAATADFTSTGRTLVACANAAAVRTAIGTVIGTDVQAYNASLADIAGITFSQGDVLYHNGTNLVRLAAGTSGYFLKTQGAGANPTWALPSGGTIADGDYGDISVSSSGTVMSIDSGVVDQANLSFTALKAGKVSYPVAAAAMIARTTNGAATGTSESTTNKVMTATLDFDQSTDEFAQFTIAMPKNWDEGTVTAQFYWTAGSTGNVIWGLQGLALSDDDAIDTAFGTAQTVTDGVTAAGDLMISAETSAITIAGTPAAGDLVVFQVYRDADNGSDTLAADAKLIQVKLFITLNAEDET